MDIGVFLPLEPLTRSASDEYKGVVECAEACESLGYHSLWIASRHFSPEYASAPSPLLVLAAAAARTSRLELGTAVVSLPLENPIRLAEDFATLDALAQGRAHLGVGSGDDPLGFRSFGVDFEGRQQTNSDLLPRLIELLEGAPVDSGGPPLYPQVTGARSKIYLGAQSVRGAGFAASLGLGLLQGRSEPTFGDPTESQAVAAQEYRLGHPQGRVVTSRNVWVGWADDPALLDGLVRHSAYLVTRGRASLPDDPIAALQKMHITCGAPEDLATEIMRTTKTINPDELLITVDPGGLSLDDRLARLTQMAAAFSLN